MSDHELGEAVVDRLRAARMTSRPWAHTYVADTLPADDVERLSRSFVDFPLVDCEETEREKTYRFATVDLDARLAREVDGGWAALVGALTGPDYRAVMSELTGVPLADSTLSLALWEYRGGDWLAPHVDKPDKLVTQIFYFTEDWVEDHRGRLLILDAPDTAAVSHALPPRSGGSAILVRSESSWHAVEPLSASATPRRSLTATFRR